MRLALVIICILLLVGMLALDFFISKNSKVTSAKTEKNDDENHQDS